MTPLTAAARVATVARKVVSSAQPKPDALAPTASVSAR